MRKIFYFFFCLTPMIIFAQDNVNVDGNVIVDGNVSGLNISGTSGIFSGSSPFRISTTAATVLDLRGNNPLIEFRDNGPNYLAFIQSFENDFYIVNRQAGRMVFQTSDLDRITIAETGDVGIGTFNHSSKLILNGPENDGINAALTVLSGTQKLIMDGNEIDCTSGGLHINYNSKNDVLFRTNVRRADISMLHNSGSGVSSGLSLGNEGNRNAYWTLYSTDVDGNLELYYKSSLRGEFNAGTGAYTQISDRRYKENIEPLSGVLAKVKALKPSVYHYKADETGNRSVGLVAQEVVTIFPEIVHKGKVGDTEEEVYTMDYSALGVIAVAAIQELMEQTPAKVGLELVRENQELREKVSDLEERLQKLEKIVEGITDN